MSVPHITQHTKLGVLRVAQRTGLDALCHGTLHAALLDTALEFVDQQSHFRRGHAAQDLSLGFGGLDCGIGLDVEFDVFIDLEVEARHAHVADHF